jgi:hypothetical protein
MKNVKLSLLLLTVMAAQPFAAEAMFARFAAFAKTKATAVKSFFSQSNTRRWSFVNPFRFGKVAMVGAVATAPLFATDTEDTNKQVMQKLRRQEKEIEAFKHYMVAIIEKVGVGKQESCSGAKVGSFETGKGEEKVWMRMQCPKTTTWGYASANTTLNTLYKKTINAEREAENAEREAKISARKEKLEKTKKEREASQGYLTMLDKQQIQQEEFWIKILEDELKWSQTPRNNSWMEAKSVTVGIFPGWFGASHYNLEATEMTPAEYSTIASSLHAQDKAEQEALKQQEATKKA